MWAKLIQAAVTVAGWIWRNRQEIAEFPDEIADLAGHDRGTTLRCPRCKSSDCSQSYKMENGKPASRTVCPACGLNSGR